jgi:hypothetical protein
MCRRVADLDKDERAIETWLRKTSLDETTRRNDIVHGDWIVTSMKIEGQEPPAALLVRTKSSRKGDPFVERDYTVGEIHDLANHVFNLNNLAWIFGTLCVPSDAPHFVHRSADGTRRLERVRDGLMVTDGGVESRPGNVYALNPYGW